MNRSGVVVYHVKRITLIGSLLGLGLLVGACSPRNMAMAQSLHNEATQTQGLSKPQVSQKPSQGIVKTTAAKADTKANLVKSNTARPHPKEAYAYPQQYSATKGEGRAQGGLYDYFDNTGSQLTDGILGGNDILADLGRGRAYEWMGWGIAQPRMQFKFAKLVNIKRVEIRFNRNDKAAVALPAKVTINGVAYKVNPNKIADKTSGFLSFEGAYVGRQIKIQITRGKGWVFIDEVRFVDP